MKKYNKAIYITMLSLLSLLLMLGYLPAARAFTSFVTPPVVLFLGLLFALMCGQPCPQFNKVASKKLLQYSVVGLGFGMNLHESLASGRDGMLFSVVSVVGTMLIGMLIGYKFLKLEKKTAYLISSGTAICGGSAIAAVGPVLKAKDSDMSIALATVFILNAIALFLFPPLGHLWGLTSSSSVCGQPSPYTTQALLWVPVRRMVSALYRLRRPSN